MSRFLSAWCLLVLTLALTGQAPTGRLAPTQAVEALLARHPPAIAEAFLLVENQRSLNWGVSKETWRTPPSNLTGTTPLRTIQRGLSPEEALMSLYFGTQSLYLWALTRETVEFHRLTASRQISTLAREFPRAVETNAPNRDLLGSELFLALFGELSADVRRKPHWILTADDALFDVPFSALAVGNSQIGKQKGKSVYLMEEHSTERIPTALLLARPAQKLEAGAFLGIGDGVYNTADSRWTSTHRQTSREARDASPELARLPGSGKELIACAREWHGSTTVLLTGLDATRTALEDGLTMRPTVIHIAAHVVEPDSGQRFIHLGLSKSGQQQILTGRDIAGFNVAGSTVVMSGCGSAALPSVESAGILGLTRAWLIAGARAVVGSRWATPDDTGELFQAFYRELRNRCDRGADGRVIGASLQHAQQQMLHSSTWRSNPSYWSAYYVVGKE
jgi:CHAT domain-containing protein